MTHPQLHPTQKPKHHLGMNTTLPSGVLVLLWLMATTAAQAAPKSTLCHKPGTVGQQIITVGERALQAHLAHGDHQVTTEVCDGIDNDCDREVDDECIATCPTACTDALDQAAVHDYSSHNLTPTDVDCTFDSQRQAGVVNFQDFGATHDDAVSVSANRCYVLVSSETVRSLIISNSEQKACAPIAAQVVEDITLEECNISP